MTKAETNRKNPDNFEKKIMEVRERILLACIERRAKEANEALQELTLIIKASDQSAEIMREAKCRLLESSLDVAQLDENPIKKTVSVLEEIVLSSDFHEERKMSVILRGLKSIGMNLMP